MALVLTPEQLDEVKQIVARHHAALVLQVVGPEALTEAEAALLEGTEVADLGDRLDVVRNSYLYGQALARAAATPETDFASFREWLARNPAQLGAAEEASVQAALQHAGAHVRHLGARFTQGLDVVYYSEDARARARVGQGVAEAVARADGARRLTSDLQRRTGDYERDWYRVAVTEKVGAMHAGQTDRYRRDYGDPWVYKRPLPGACKHCLRLHLGPDGYPRMFKLSDLEANGTNAGRRSADWTAVVGPTHPHCACVLARVPPGWGFDEDGDLVPDGEFGVRYEGGVQKAVEAEDTLQKAFRTRGRLDFQGLSVVLEQRVGDVRRWTDPAGYAGQTRMYHAYGYIEGTRGADGDEYDCYVGPDPRAEFAYVVHQDDPTTGEYDEDKVMLGFSNVHAAREAYLVHYDREEFLGSVSAVPVAEFVEKVAQTRKPGSFQSDGMVKAAGDLWEVEAAQHSGMEDRGVGGGTSGPNLVLGAATLFDHLQAGVTGVQWTTDQLASAGVRGGRLADRRYVARKDPDLYRHFARDVGSVGVNIYPLDPDDGTATQLGLPALAEIPRNRFHLDEEVRRRARRTAPNVADPSRQNRDAPELLKAGPFIGPRGDKWADPEHTISWKDPWGEARPPGSVKVVFGKKDVRTVVDGVITFKYEGKDYFLRSEEVLDDYLRAEVTAKFVKKTGEGVPAAIKKVARENEEKLLRDAYVEKFESEFLDDAVTDLTFDEVEVQFADDGIAREDYDRAVMHRKNLDVCAAFDAEAGRLAAKLMRVPTDLSERFSREHPEVAGIELGDAVSGDYTFHDVSPLLDSHGVEASSFEGELVISGDDLKSVRGVDGLYSVRVPDPDGGVTRFMVAFDPQVRVRMFVDDLRKKLEKKPALAERFAGWEEHVRWDPVESKVHLDTAAIYDVEGPDDEDEEVTERAFTVMDEAEDARDKHEAARPDEPGPEWKEEHERLLDAVVEAEERAEKLYFAFRSAYESSGKEWWSNILSPDEFVRNVFGNTAYTSVRFEGIPGFRDTVLHVSEQRHHEDTPEEEHATPESFERWKEDQGNAPISDWQSERREATTSQILSRPEVFPGEHVAAKKHLYILDLGPQGQDPNSPTIEVAGVEYERQAFVSEYLRGRVEGAGHGTAMSRAVGLVPGTPVGTHLETQRRNMREHHPTESDLKPLAKSAVKKTPVLREAAAR